MSDLIIIIIVYPSGVKKTTISSVQSSYIAMGPKMADNADPSQELSLTMRAGHCRIVGWKRVAFSRLSQFTSPFGLTDSLLLEMAVPLVTLLCHLRQSWVTLSMLSGSMFFEFLPQKRDSHQLRLAGQ